MESNQPLPCVLATPKEINQDGGVQQDRCQLPDTAVIGTPLLANPLAGIFVPLMTTIRDRTNGRLEQVPAVIIVKSALDRAGDVCAPTTGTDATVQLLDERVRERNVYSHGHNITH
jgi:hypothetical protein